MRTKEENLAILDAYLENFGNSILKDFETGTIEMFKTKKNELYSLGEEMVNILLSAKDFGDDLIDIDINSLEKKVNFSISFDEFYNTHISVTIKDATEFIHSDNFSMKGLMCKALLHSIKYYYLHKSLKNNGSYDIVKFLNIDLRNYQNNLAETYFQILLSSYLLIYEEIINIDVFTPQEFLIFCYIGKERKSEIFASGIKNRINTEMTLNTISKALQRFQKSKYLEKLPASETFGLDQRVTFYGLTPKGHIFYKKIKNKVGPYLQD